MKKSERERVRERADKEQAGRSIRVSQRSFALAREAQTRHPWKARASQKQQDGPIRRERRPSDGRGRHDFFQRRKNQENISRSTTERQGQGEEGRRKLGFVRVRRKRSQPAHRRETRTRDDGEEAAEEGGEGADEGAHGRRVTGRENKHAAARNDAPKKRGSENAGKCKERSEQANKRTSTRTHPTTTIARPRLVRGRHRATSRSEGDGSKTKRGASGRGDRRRQPHTLDRTSGNGRTGQRDSERKQHHTPHTTHTTHHTPVTHHTPHTTRTRTHAPRKRERQG